jgi:hypothetical protein
VSFPTAAGRPPRALLIVLGVLVVAFILTLVIVVAVARPPSYDPVPIPSVSRT